MFGMYNPLKRVSINKMIEDQRYEARRGSLEHRASAEHHKALADMYDLRLKRISIDHPDDNSDTVTSLRKIG